MPLIGMWLSILALLSTGALASSGSDELRWPARSRDKAGEPHCADSLPDGTRILLGIRLNSDPGNLFVDVLGPSPGHGAGDGRRGRNWQCWAATNGDGTVLVARRGVLVDEFEVLGREMPFPARPTCARSKLVSRKLATANGLRIGIFRSDVEAKVGAPSRAGKRWLQRTCNSRKPMTDEDRDAWEAPPGAHWDILSAMTALFDDADRMVAFRVTWSAVGP
jgi:hypothetical protein